MDYSHLETEWHPTRNLPMNFNLSLNKKVKYWWIGRCGHEWTAPIKSRLNSQGCQVCAYRQLLTGFNDLATVNPQLAAEWHPTKNGELTASQVIYASSPIRIWWKDKHGHEWETHLYSRTKYGSGCPVCSNQQILTGFNDLASQSPEIAAEWHPSKNGELTPKQVAPKANKKVWWLGTCGHEWETTINNRVRRGDKCPVCSNQKLLTGFNDLATIYPKLAAEWHPIKNGELTASQVIHGAHQKVWWSDEYGHEWESSPSIRTSRNFGCPVCSNQQILAGFNDLASQNPKLAAEWHPIKNGELTPQQITTGSNQKVWWLGNECGHEWRADPYHRTRRGDGCSICSNRTVLLGFNDLASQSPEIAAEWHPTKNGNTTPETITTGSNRKVWWQCRKGHEWETRVHVRNTSNSPCYICANRTVLIGFNDLASRYPDIASEWHPTKNGDLTPELISLISTRKLWWVGDCGHEWSARLNHRVKRGSGCSQCSASTFVSKAEQEIYDYICSLDVNMKVDQSNRNILGKNKELDIFIPSKMIAVEFNGVFWHSEAAGKGINYHYEKWLRCKSLDIQLIQIWENDWNDKSEQIKRIIARKLKIDSNQSNETTVIPITANEANQFLVKTHLQGFESGSYYLGVIETENINQLQAVMVLKNKLDDRSESLEITRYASITNDTDDFSKLVAYATHAYNPESFSVIADHCEADEKLYVTSGFIAEKEIPPDYMYVFQMERKARSDYSIERFRDDPKLQWSESLTEMELADLNGLNRIWDAGKTRYRLYV